MITIIFTGRIRGHDHLWIIGDDFVCKDNMAETQFARKEESTSFSTKTFDIHIQATDSFNSNNENVPSRLRNALYHAFNKTWVLPKIIVMILEDDVIKYYKKKADRHDLSMDETQCRETYERCLKWLMSECRKFAATIREDILPSRAKRQDWPNFLWILPSLHKNYTNRKYRRIFSETIKKVARPQDNTFTLELKQVWDENDGNLYLWPDKRYSQAGYISYWTAVDRTVRVCNSIINRSEFSKLVEKYNNAEAVQPTHPRPPPRVVINRQAYNRPRMSEARAYDRRDYKEDRRRRLPTPP